METTLKKCPFCCEEILEVAKKCKHCGEWIEQYSIPKKTRICNSCAEEIEEGLEICPFCKEKTSTVSKSSVFYTYFWQTIVNHYADFKETFSRKGYWFFVLFYMFGFILTASLDVLFQIDFKIYDVSVGYGWIYLTFAFALFLPSLSATIRRLKDVGKKGTWILIALIPIVGAIWLLILLCNKGRTTEIVKWKISDTIITICLILALVVVGIFQYTTLNNSELDDNNATIEFTVGTDFKLQGELESSKKLKIFLNLKIGEKIEENKYYVHGDFECEWQSDLIEIIGICITWGDESELNISNLYLWEKGATNDSDLLFELEAAEFDGFTGTYYGGNINKSCWVAFDKK